MVVGTEMIGGWVAAGAVVPGTGSAGGGRVVDGWTTIGRGGSSGCSPGATRIAGSVIGGATLIAGWVIGGATETPEPLGPWPEPMLMVVTVGGAGGA